MASGIYAQVGNSRLLGALRWHIAFCFDSRLTVQNNNVKKFHNLGCIHLVFTRISGGPTATYMTYHSISRQFYMGIFLSADTLICIDSVHWCPTNGNGMKMLAYINAQRNITSSFSYRSGSSSESDSWLHAWLSISATFVLQKNADLRVPITQFIITYVNILIWTAS